jgi:diguanylate cyclase (GGDEF)-like protein
VTERDSDGVGNFVDAAGSVLTDLRARIGLDTWLVSRRDGDDYVVLSTSSEGMYGIEPGAVFPWEDTFCTRMLDQGAPMAAADVDAVPAYVEAREKAGFEVGSCLIVPMRAPDGQFLGTICALDRDPHPGLEQYLSTVQLQASLLGAFLTHELRLEQEVRRAHQAESVAHTDALTGVGNRRAWDEALRSEEARAHRYASPTAVMVIDLDGLKQINDSAGHLAGDRLLSQTATLLNQRLRALDVLARLGGDEFGVLLPETSAPEAEQLLADLREVLDEAGIAASVGIGQRHSETGLLGAWRAADVAMYADKLQAAGKRIPRQLIGRRTRVSSSEPTAGLGSVDALLQLARRQLGMEVAFLGAFEGDNRRIRNAASIIELPIGPGYLEPRESTFCQLIVDRAVPEVIPDVAANSLARELEITTVLGIGSYIGVPVHRRNGTLYGTLCAFSRRAELTLRQRDTEVLKAIAIVAMDLVEAEDRRENDRYRLLQRLDGLYAEGGPAIAYQAVHALSDLETIGVEALSRFPQNSSDPGDWFSSASEAGVGVKLELAALRNAITILPGLTGFLSLNVSPATLVSPVFTRLMSTLPLDRIVVEITDHQSVEDYVALKAVLSPLRDQGLRIAVDDAGAGFASTRHVLALAPEFIKLDMSLVRDIDTDPARQALAVALNAFASKTGSAVVAEGIETAAELDCLRGLQIGLGQGFHLSPPLEAELDLRPLIRDATG